MAEDLNQQVYSTFNNKLKLYFSPVLRKSGGKKAIASAAAL